MAVFLFHEDPPLKRGGMMRCPRNSFLVTGRLGTTQQNAMMNLVRWCIHPAFWVGKKWDYSVIHSLLLYGVFTLSNIHPLIHIHATMVGHVQHCFVNIKVAHWHCSNNETETWYLLSIRCALFLHAPDLPVAFFFPTLVFRHMLYTSILCKDRHLYSLFHRFYVATTRQWSHFWSDLDNH